MTYMFDESHILAATASQHDGAKDGDGNDEHSTVAADLVVVPSLGYQCFVSWGWLVQQGAVIS